ncbi:MAG: ABC transporter substrate-binding protein [Spirochaetia bacterium]|jgi:NitT/TauT family transport system substrate-binding protein|nr:ABC transporter substrate-binding protein [Spirochaetia bacterium]
MKKLILIFVIFYFSVHIFAAGSSESNPATTSLTVAFLPIIDALPLYIAEEQGYFLEENLDVKALSVANPIERDRLMQSGEIDGMLNELSTLALFNRDEIQLKAVITVRKPMTGSPYFRILASPGSKISSPLDLAGIPIAVSKNTVIEYLTMRILQAEGVPADSIKTKNVPVIPERFQLLMSGALSAATLPDPLGEAAIAAGAILVTDDLSHPEFSISVLSFTTALTDNNSHAVKGFIRAWNKAVKDLNSNPETFRKLFLEKVRVPEIIENTFRIPEFPYGEIPDQNQWNDVINWLQEKKLLETSPLYESSITDIFISTND